MELELLGKNLYSDRKLTNWDEWVNRKYTSINPADLPVASGQRT
jgi:hypothetical protein